MPHYLYNVPNFSLIFFFFLLFNFSDGKAWINHVWTSGPCPNRGWCLMRAALINKKESPSGLNQWSAASAPYWRQHRIISPSIGYSHDPWIPTHGGAIHFPQSITDTFSLSFFINDLQVNRKIESTALLMQQRKSINECTRMWYKFRNWMQAG